MEMNRIQKEIMIILLEKGKIRFQELKKELEQKFPDEIKQSTLYVYLDLIKNLRVQSRRGGGIELATQSEKLTESAFYKKLDSERLCKEVLAEYIVTSPDCIRHGDTVFLDCGTTAYIIADKLIEHKKMGLTLITVNPYVLKRVLDFPEIGQVSVIGGLLNWTNGALLGPSTMSSLEKLPAIGTLILGVDAISSEGQLGINFEVEIEQKKLLIEKAKKIIIPITYNKFKYPVSYEIGNVSKWQDKEVLILLSYKYTDENKRLELEDKINKLRNIVGKDNFMVLDDKTE